MSQDSDTTNAKPAYSAMEHECAWARCTQALLYLWYFAFHSAHANICIALLWALGQTLQFCHTYRVTPNRMCGDTGFVEFMIELAKLTVVPLMWFAVAWGVGVLTALILAINMVGSKDINIVMSDLWCYVRAKMAKLRTALCDRLTWVDRRRATLVADVPCPTTDNDKGHNDDDILVRFIIYTSFLTSVLVLVVVLAVRNLPEQYLMPATVAVASTIRQGAWALLMVLLSFISMGTLFGILFAQTIINAALPLVRFFAVSICITCLTAFCALLSFEVTGVLSPGTTAKTVRVILIDWPNICIAYMQSFCIAVVYGALRIPRKQTDATHRAAAATTVLAASKEE